MAISPTNNQPTSSDTLISLIEDTTYIFKLADFPFSDLDGQSVKFVKFKLHPNAGEVYLRGIKIQVNQEISAEDIASGALSYIPPKNAEGRIYGSFLFSVSDGTSYSTEHSAISEISPVEDAPTLHVSQSYFFGKIPYNNSSELSVLNPYRPVEGGIGLAMERNFYHGGVSWYVEISLDRSLGLQMPDILPPIELAYQFQNASISSVSALDNGKFLVAGIVRFPQSAQTQITLARFDENGNLDQNFNDSGIVNFEFPYRVIEIQVTVQSDGKYLVGTKGWPSMADQRISFTLDRFNTDGTIDTGFYRFDSDFLEVTREQNRMVVVQEDGKILIICKQSDSGALVAVRVNADGSRDQQFGSNAFARLYDDQSEQVPIDTAIDHFGRIVILSKGISKSGQPTVDLVRLNPDGSVDKSLSDDGHLSFSFDGMNLPLGKIKNLVLSPDGKIIVTGTVVDGASLHTYDDEVFILRFDQNGNVDHSFDSDGIVQLSIQEIGEIPLNLIVQPDGKLLLSATSSDHKQYYFFARWNDDGSVDNSFNRPTISTQSASSGVILDTNIWISDAELRYRTGRQEELTIRRSGTANSEDIFFFPEKFASGSDIFISYAGKIYQNDRVIASFSSLDGSLKLKFEGYLHNDNNISTILRNLRYSNIQSGDERLLTFDWTFDEAINGQPSIGTAQTEVLVLASNNSIPISTNLHGVLNPKSNHVFSLAEFQFRDRDDGDTFQGITILSLPENKGLFLDNVEVKKDQFISKSDIENGFLRFRSLDLSDGHFKFSVSDGKVSSIAYDWSADVVETILIAPELFTIGGNYTQGQALTAILKANDVGDLASIRYQWVVNGFLNSQSNQVSYTPSGFDVGNQIDVIIHYQDTLGNMKIYRANGSTPIQIGNDAPIGKPIINGQYVIGEKLSFVGGVSDGDGIEQKDGQANFTYQWKENGNAIPGETSTTLLLTPTLIGKKISLELSYFDLKGKLETVIGGKIFAVNDFTKFSVDDKIKYANTGDNIFIGSTTTDTVMINHSLKDYVFLMHSNNEYRLLGEDSIDGYHVFRDIEHLRFQDFSVNLEVTSKARSTPLSDVNRLIELYISFFNRIPDADGLSYWIGEFNSGKSISEIAKSFHDAGVLYSELTGFSKTMSDEDFINVVYKNTLGRQDGADAEGLKYWSEQLKSGKATYGSLVSEILNSAHASKGTANWGWVADLLDNKIFAASKIAIDWGISFNSPEESITRGMDVIAAVTPTDSWEAIKLIGLGVDGIYL